MPMSPKERMQVYRKRLKGILPPSPLRLSAAKKVLKERQRAKLTALSNDEAASGDDEEQKEEDGDREMKSTRNEQQSSKTPTTDKPFITVIKSNDSQEVSESASSGESEEDSEPINKATGSDSNKYALPSPYKNLPSVSVCLKEEDRLLAQRELGRTLLRTSPASSNGASDVNKSPRAAKIPGIKKKRAEKPAPKVTGRKNDCYCWVCHRENIALVCIGCPRAFHHKCAGESRMSPTNWVCPECNKTLHAEAVDTQSSVLSEISVDKLCSLLKFSLYKLKQRGGTAFHIPVSFADFPMYPHYVIHPMDFSLIEKNIKQKLYGSTEAFLSDVKWILHNSCVFNGAQHPLSNNAKSVVKNCENDMQEIEICPDCFMHGANRNNKYWFSEVCGKPHPLVWAKLKGFPFWPAKVVRIVDGNVDARFFGAHDRAWVPVNQCYHLSKESPTTSKPKKKGNYENALDELNVHVHLLIQKFGTFEYAPHRQVFDPTNKKHMFHGIDIDKISKEEIPVESTSIVTSEMCSSPMDPGKIMECKTTQDSLETPSKATESESGIALLKDKEMDNSVNTQRKSAVVDLTESKEKSDSVNIPSSSAPGKSSYDPSGLNKFQKVLEKIKGIVSNNDEDESEEAERDEDDNHQESVKPVTVNSETNVNDNTNETNIKKPESSIIAGLIKSKPLPSLDIITEDIPEEPPVSILNTSNRNDLFSLKLNETIESCKAKLGISEVNDSMDIDSEDDDDDEEEEEDDDEEMEQDSDEDEAEKKDNSGSEQSGVESSEESDADQSDSASSNTDIEEVSVYVKDPEKSEGHSVSEENNSNSSEKVSEKSKESLKDSQEMDISESRDLSTDKSSDHQIEKKSSPGKHNMSDENKNNTDFETDEDEHMSGNNDCELVNDAHSNGSQTDTALSQEKLNIDVSSADSKEQKSEPAKDESTEKTQPSSSTKGNESEEDDDIFICDPPPKPPTPPLICLDDGTDETEPEAEEKTNDSRKEEKRKAEELLQKEEAEYIRKQLKAALGKPMPKNARKSIKRVLRPATPASSEDEEEGEVVPPPNRVSLSGAKRTFTNRSSAAPAAKRARANENQQFSPSLVETSKDADARDTDEEVEAEEGPSKRNTSTTPDQDQAVVIDGIYPYETTFQPTSEAEMILDKVKRRLMRVNAAYKYQCWKLMQEKAEMKHNMNLTLLEMRSSLEAEKRHALDAQSQTLSLEKTKCVEEAKKKQWCASCLQESRYACCWNTSYCTLTCQKKHFSIHRKTCTQLKLKNVSSSVTEVNANDGKKVVLLNMLPKSDANKLGTSANQPTVQIPLAKVVAQKPTQHSQSVNPSSIQFVFSTPAQQQQKPATIKNKIANTTEDTETKTDDSSTTTPAECVQTVLEEKKELSLEERYFPSPPTVSFEGLDSALPDESVRFDDLTEDVSDASDTDTAGKTGDSSPDEDLEFSDDDKKADNELVSLGYGVEVKAKFLNKCLIYGKTAKKLTRCLVDVIFPDTKLLANCSALGNKSNLTKLTRAALPSRKVACIIDYVKKRFPDANKSEIVLVMNLKCKEARAIIGKSGPDGKNPVVRRLLAKEQELESSAVSSHPQKMQSAGVPKIKLPPPPKVQKLTTVNKTSPTTTVTTTAPVTVLRQPPNIVCVQKNPSNAALSPLLQQKGIRTGLVQLRLPMNTAPTSTLAHRPPAILGKPTTVLKVPPRTRPETIRTILTRAQPQVGKMGGNKILLPLHFIHQKAGSALGKPSETTDAATGSQRQCIIVGARTAEATSSTPQTAATNSQNPCTSTVKQE